MNESTLTQLKILVERAVRPVRASIFRKRKMREELLAHVTAVFEEEVGRLGDERIALERAEQRFGNPAELTGQLQASIPANDLCYRSLDWLLGQPGESALRRAGRLALVMFLVCAATLLPAYFLQGRLWAVVLDMSVCGFGFAFLSDSMRQILYDGPRGRSWRKAALVAAASWVLIPGVTFGVLLIYSGDVRSSLMDVLPLLPGAVLPPVFFVASLYGFAAEIRSHREWASLQIN
jgi:ATP-dependent Clp protease ATP-binding subunit ClpC